MCRLVPREVAVSSTYSLCRVLKCRLVSREVAVSSTYSLYRVLKCVVLFPGKWLLVLRILCAEY